MDPASVDRGALGIRSIPDHCRWMFSVVSPYTMGERERLIRHDCKVVPEMMKR